MPTQPDQGAAGYWYPRTDATRSAIEVLDAMRRYRTAEQALRRRTRDAMGMGETDLLAMRHLIDAEQGGRLVTAVDLARLLDISSASTSVLIDRLVARGHVTRESHPTDRRSIAVVPTDSAHREVPSTLGSMHQAMLEAATVLSAEEARVVVEFFERMRVVVDAEG